MENLQKKDILITGGSGLVLSRFIEMYQSQYNIWNLSLNSLQQENVKYIRADLLDKMDLLKSLKKFHFDYIVHAAAYTDVKAAEESKSQEENSTAWKVNVMGNSKSD